MSDILPEAAPIPAADTDAPAPANPDRGGGPAPNLAGMGYDEGAAALAPGGAVEQARQPDGGGYVPEDHERNAASIREVVPKRHMVFEQLVHTLAYADSLSDEQKHDLYAWGYTPVHTVMRGANDLELYPFEPDERRKNEPYVRQLHQGDVKPVVAFRGSYSLEDVNTDFEPGGVGRSQWLLNEALIMSQVHRLSTHGKVVVSGHSLGGALAQLVAANYPSLISEVVTFESPAIPAHVAEMLEKHNEGASERDKVHSTHYQVAGDVVDETGERWTPGSIVHMDLDEDGPVDAHTAEISRSVTGPNGAAWVGADPESGHGAINPGELENFDMEGTPGDDAIESVKITSTQDWEKNEKNNTIEEIRKHNGNKRLTRSREMHLQSEAAAGARAIVTGLQRWADLWRYLIAAKLDDRLRNQIVDNMSRAFKDLWLADNMLRGRIGMRPTPLAAVQREFADSRCREMTEEEIGRTQDFFRKHGTEPGARRAEDDDAAATGAPNALDALDAAAIAE